MFHLDQPPKNNLRSEQMIRHRLLPHQRWLDAHCPRHPVSSGSEVGQDQAGIERHGPVAAGKRQGELWVNRKTRELEDKEELWLEGRYLSQKTTATLLLGSDNDGLGD